MILFYIAHSFQTRVSYISKGKL